MGHGSGSQEVGLLEGDAHLHAAMAALTGPRAACGGGPILTRVGGRFDGEADHSCPRCVLALEASGQGTAS